jgi:hypothetical protein
MQFEPELLPGDRHPDEVLGIDHVVVVVITDVMLNPTALDV